MEVKAPSQYGVFALCLNNKIVDTIEGKFQKMSFYLHIKVVDYFKRDAASAGTVIALNDTENTTYVYGGISLTFPPMKAGSQAVFAIASSSIPNYKDPSTGTTPGTYRGVSFFVSLFGADGYNAQPPSAMYFSIAGVNEDTDAIYLYNSVSRVWASATATCGASASSVVENGTLTASVCHLTQFALFNIPATTTGSSEVPIEKSSDKTAILVVSIVLPIVVAILIVILIVLLWRQRRNRNLNRNEEEPRAVEMTESKSKPKEESTSPVATKKDLVSVKVDQTVNKPNLVQAASTTKEEEEEEDETSSSSASSSSSSLSTSSSESESEPEKLPPKATVKEEQSDSESESEEESKSEESETSESE